MNHFVDFKRGETNFYYISLAEYYVPYTVHKIRLCFINREVMFSREA